MADGTTLAAWITALFVSLPLVTFCAELLVGLRRAREAEAPRQAASCCILMPAHNEAAIIGATLDTLLPELSAQMHVLVVADNCSDGTAEIARGRGANVIERHDATLRGKGYALAFGRDRLRHSAPACVIILDADCRSDGASLQNLVAAALTHDRPVQASYTFEPDLETSPRVQISNFAFWIKNVVRQRGAQRLGGAAVLTGTGMAFPWPLFDRLSLETSNIVEDLALAVELTSSGQAPLFVEYAQVTSIAASESATLEQRSRWETGFLKTARKFGLPTLRAGMRSGNLQLVLFGLHLLVPPLALLLLIAGSFAIAFALSSVWLDHLRLPAAFLWGLLCFTFCGVLLAWARGGRRWLSARSLLSVPFYILWKVPIYARLLMGKSVSWVRTDRTLS